MNYLQQLTLQEIAEVRNLLEIEKIKTLRMQYSYLMDSRQLQAFYDLFSEDAICEFGPYGIWRGRDDIIKNFNTVFEETLEEHFWSMHANTGHQVKITSPTTAEGQIYLLDVQTDKKPDENPFLWFAVYDEDYVKIADHWKIKRSSIHFLWPEKHLDPQFIGR